MSRESQVDGAAALAEKKSNTNLVAENQPVKDGLQTIDEEEDPNAKAPDGDNVANNVIADAATAAAATAPKQATTDDDLQIILDDANHIDQNEYILFSGSRLSVDAEVPVEEKLDRAKLLLAYKAISDVKADVDKKNDLLNKALLKHFKINKVYRAFSPEATEQIPELQAKYRQCLDEMDLVFSFDRRRSADCQKLMSDRLALKEQLVEEFEVGVAKQEKQLRDHGLVMRSTQTGKYLEADVLERWIKNMDHVRKNISEVRLNFIKTLDKHTEIDMKAKALEDLGNGLKMIDFEHMRAERQSLSDKIEERNNELEKLRIRCFADNQILAHVREKEFMVENVIRKEREELQYLSEEGVEVRNYSNRIKGERDQLRKKLNNMRETCGILDKPELLADYDNLTKTIGNQKETITRLKDFIADLEGKTASVPQNLN